VLFAVDATRCKSLVSSIGGARLIRPGSGSPKVSLTVFWLCPNIADGAPQVLLATLDRRGIAAVGVTETDALLRPMAVRDGRLPAILMSPTMDFFRFDEPEGYRYKSRGEC